MDLTLIKLSLERLHDQLEKLKKRNVEIENSVRNLKERLNLKSFVMTTQTSDGFEDELLDTKQVRKYLGISHNTLQAIVQSGKLIQKRINGHNIRYSKADVMIYIQSLT